MAEQPGLWQQNDLLGLLATAPQLSPPPGADSEPASAPAAAPLQTSGADPQERTPAAASAVSEPPTIAYAPLESGPFPSGLTPDLTPGLTTGASPEISVPTSSQSNPEPDPQNAHEHSTLPVPQAGSQPGPLSVPQVASHSDLEAGPQPTPPQSGPQPIALPTLAPVARRSGPNAPERILILDTETTALSPQDGLCIEVGAVLFHVPSRSVLQQLSFLLPCPSNPAEAINGLPAAVTRLQQPLEPAMDLFLAQVRAAEVVVAHNAAFDRQWFGHGCLPELPLPWICSMEDIRWPAERLLKPNPSVRDLALAYGVPVWAAHRALTDCQYLVHVFERCADLEALLLAAQEPRQLYRARLSYAERHQAREAGFRWNDPVAGAWSRRLSERELESLPFAVIRVDQELVSSSLPQIA